MKPCMRMTGKGNADGGRGETTRGLVAGGMVFSSRLLFAPQGKIGKAGVVIRRFYFLPWVWWECSEAAQLSPSTPFHDRLEGAIGAHMHSLHFIQLTQ